MPHSKRSRARMLALQALCVFDEVGDSFDEDLDAFVRDRIHHADLGWTKPLDEQYLRMARDFARAAWKGRAEYDRLLTEHVRDWSIPRMQPVDRNILRLGLYELLECPETAPAVVLNEAIELARQFGGNESAAFVNGVLDNLRKKLDIATSPETAGAGEPPAE